MGRKTPNPESQANHHRKQAALDNAKASLELTRMYFKTLFESCQQPMIRGAIEQVATRTPRAHKIRTSIQQKDPRLFRHVAEMEGHLPVEIPDTPKNKMILQAIENYCFALNQTRLLFRDCLMTLVALEHAIDLHATLLPSTFRKKPTKQKTRTSR